MAQLARLGRGISVTRSGQRDRASGVAGPWFCGSIGVEEGDLGAAAEGFGDEGGRALEDELADGAVAGAEEVTAEVAEAIHDGVGVQGPPGEGAGEEPRTVRPRAGAEVWPCREVVSDERGEWFGDVGRVRAEEDAHAGLGVVDDAGGEGDDLDERLGVEQEQHPGDAVGE